MTPRPDRRAFLRSLAGGLAAAACSSGCASAPTAERIVDTHTHFYDPTRPQGAPWPPKGSFLDRPVLPPDWQKVARSHGIRETVVVEASAWPQDNDWVLRLIEQYPYVLGYIGNLRPGDGTFAGHLRRLLPHPLFRGLRINAARLTQDLADPAFRRNLGLLADHGLAVDLNGFGDFAGAVALARSFPALRFVIDHVGNVRDPHQPDAAWRDGMSRLGEQENLFCKVSGLVEPVKGPAGSAPTGTDYYRPTLDHVARSFGPRRLLFGSNWPVSDKGADFAGVFRVVSGYFAERPAAEREDFYWSNAHRAYRWTERS